MFRNELTSHVVFIFHFIILLGKTVLKGENTMNEILFNLYMLMSSDLKNIFYKELLMYTCKNITALSNCSLPLTHVNRMDFFFLHAIFGSTGT